MKFLALRHVFKQIHSAKATRRFEGMNSSKQKHWAKRDRKISHYVMKRQGYFK